MIYSPLRYPGGKGKLAPFMKVLIEKTGHKAEHILNLLQVELGLH